MISVLLRIVSFSVPRKCTSHEVRGHVKDVEVLVYAFQMDGAKAGDIVTTEGCCRDVCLADLFFRWSSRFVYSVVLALFAFDVSFLRGALRRRSFTWTCLRRHNNVERLLTVDLVGFISGLAGLSVVRVSSVWCSKVWRSNVWCSKVWRSTFGYKIGTLQFGFPNFLEGRLQGLVLGLGYPKFDFIVWCPKVWCGVWIVGNGS